MNFPSKTVFEWEMKAILASAVILLLAIVACKAPTSIVSPQSNPTISLNMPDTVFWGDSCIMTASISDTSKQGRELKWSISDSTTIFGTDSILHYFLNPGIDTVTVTLLDTVHHLTIATKSAIVHVVARHFNLAFLKTMKKVDVDWKAFIDTAIQGTTNIGACGIAAVINSYLIEPLSWSGTGFSMSHDTSYRDSIPGELEAGYGSESTGLNGDYDPGFTQLTDISYGNNNVFFSGQYEAGAYYCYSTYNSSLTINQIPFISESDSDVVFEAFGMTSKNDTFQSTIYGRSMGRDYTINFHGSWSGTNPSFIPYIRIRFHN